MLEAVTEDTVRPEPTVSGEEEVDVLPLADDELSAEPTQLRPRPKDEPEADDDVIPLSAEFLDEAEWTRRRTAILRNLLSQMDEGRPLGKDED